MNVEKKTLKVSDTSAQSVLILTCVKVVRQFQTMIIHSWKSSIPNKLLLSYWLLFKMMNRIHLKSMDKEFSFLKYHLWINCLMSLVNNSSKLTWIHLNVHGNKDLTGNKKEKKNIRWKKDANLRKRPRLNKRSQLKRSNLRSNLRLRLKLEEEFSKSFFQSQFRCWRLRERQTKRLCRTRNTYSPSCKIQFNSKTAISLQRNTPPYQRRISWVCTSQKSIENCLLDLNFWFRRIFFKLNYT